MKKETPHNFTEHVFKKNWSMWWDGMWWDGILSALLLVIGKCQNLDKIVLKLTLSKRLSTTLRFINNVFHPSTCTRYYYLKQKNMCYSVPPQLLPSHHKLRNSKTKKPSQNQYNILKPWFFLFRNINCPNIWWSGTFCWFFFSSFVRKLKKTLSKCGGTELFYYFSYFLISRNTRPHFFWYQNDLIKCPLSYQKQFCCYLLLLLNYITFFNSVPPHWEGAIFIFICLYLANDALFYRKQFWSMNFNYYSTQTIKYSLIQAIWNFTFDDDYFWLWPQYMMLVWHTINT